MNVISKLQRGLRNRPQRSGPRLLTVKDAFHLTPNMIRVIFSGPELEGFPTGCDGGNCKLLLPSPGETKEDFATRLATGHKLVKRTYTVRSFDAQTGELIIDFVDHGDNGPASQWANHAKSGDFLGFAGPSGPKVTNFDADWFLVAADPSAIPVAAATLEAMPNNAKGIAIFEVTSIEDKQCIDIPEGIDVHWLVHPDPSKPSQAQYEFLQNLDWPSGRVETCVAGESGVIRQLRDFLNNEMQVPRKDTYISGYWKIGLVEDEHQKFKRAGG